MRAGYRTDGRGPLLTHGVRISAEIRRLHHTEYYLHMLEGLGIPAAGREVRLQCTDEERNWARQQLGDGPWAAINPGAAFGAAKRWYPERFAGVADGLAFRLRVQDSARRRSRRSGDRFRNRARDEFASHEPDRPDFRAADDGPVWRAWTWLLQTTPGRCTLPRHSTGLLWLFSVQPTIRRPLRSVHGQGSFANRPNVLPASSGNAQQTTGAWQIFRQRTFSKRWMLC